MKYFLERWNQETKRTKEYTLEIRDIEIDGGEEPGMYNPGSGAGANFTVWFHGKNVDHLITASEELEIVDYILENA